MPRRPPRVSSAAHAVGARRRHDAHGVRRGVAASHVPVTFALERDGRSSGTAAGASARWRLGAAAAGDADGCAPACGGNQTGLRMRCITWRGEPGHRGDGDAGRGLTRLRDHAPRCLRHPRQRCNEAAEMQREGRRRGPRRARFTHPTDDTRSAIGTPYTAPHARSVPHRAHAACTHARTRDAARTHARTIGIRPHGPLGAGHKAARSLAAWSDRADAAEWGTRADVSTAQRRTGRRRLWGRVGRRSPHADGCGRYQLQCTRQTWAQSRRRRGWGEPSPGADVGL